MFDISDKLPLSFPLMLTSGRVIETIGDAVDYFTKLTLEQREKSHWKVAMQMLNNAVKEAAYLKAATMSLRTAFVLEGVLQSPD